jgi:hypothetical protein
VSSHASRELEIGEPKTMYLVATAMDLAPYALGTGDASLFATMLGEDYVRESAVGEFVLGSLPTGAAVRGESNPDGGDHGSGVAPALVALNASDDATRYRRASRCYRW